MTEARRGLEIYPTSLIARSNLAHYAMYAGEFSAAEQEARPVADAGYIKAYMALGLSLLAEGKIAEAPGKDGRVACFNTGLASERQEAIFAVFSENRAGGPNAAPWVLDQFAKESDRVLTFFAQRPDIANYFADPTELLYDTRIDLVVDVDHVIGDNDERFPAELRGNEFAMRSALDGAISAAKRRESSGPPGDVQPPPRCLRERSDRHCRLHD